MYSREIINIFVVVFFVGQVSGLVKNLNGGIYSCTINVTNVKLCMMVLLIELNLIIPLPVALTIFQCHSNIEQFSLVIVCSFPVQLKLCRNDSVCQVDYKYTTIFHFCRYSREMIGMFSDLSKTLTFALWWTLFKGDHLNFA